MRTGLLSVGVILMVLGEIFFFIYTSIAVKNAASLAMILGALLTILGLVLLDYEEVTE